MPSDLVVAQGAALLAAELGMRYFERVSHLSPERKADGTVVTEADLAVEGTIRDYIARHRPDDGFLGEEGGESGDRRRRWVVDPIDGSAMFVAGDDRWLILVALEEHGEVLAGVAAVPAQRSCWWAGRGGGAFTGDIEGRTLVRERSISVAEEVPALAGARLGVVPEPWADGGATRRLSAVVSPVAWTAHPALLVASGQLDLAVQSKGKVWDYAATSLIVEEAGGRFSGARGQGYPFSGPALYSANDAVRVEALKYLT